MQLFCSLTPASYSLTVNDDTSLKTLHLKRLQVHITQELRAASQTKPTPPVVPKNSVAATAFRGGSSSPTFGVGGILSSNGTSAGFFSSGGSMFSFPSSPQPAFGATLAASLPFSQPPPPSPQPLTTSSSPQSLPLAQASLDQAAAEQASGSTPHSGATVKHEDAIELLERIRDRFSEQPFIYNSFLAMMREFKSQSITTQNCIDRVKLLFQGHPDLVDGFNMFLPADHRIVVDWTEASNPTKDQKAKQFSTSYEPCANTVNCNTHTYIFIFIPLLPGSFADAVLLQLRFCHQSQGAFCQRPERLQRFPQSTSQVSDGTPLR